MNILKFQYECKQLDLESCGFKTDVIQQLKQLLTPHQLQKTSQEQKQVFVDNLITQTTYVQKDKQVAFARFLSVCLTELCLSDYRFELLILQNSRFSQLFEFLTKNLLQTFTQHLDDSQIQSLQFCQFVAVCSRRLQFGQPKFEAVQQIFVDIFDSLNEFDQQETELLQFKLQIICRFLGNEYLVARLFQFRLDFEIFELFFDQKNKEFDNQPLEKLIKLFQQAVQGFHPPIIYQLVVAMWILSFHSQLTDKLVQNSVTPVLLRALSQKNIQQNAKLVNIICQLLLNLHQNEKCIAYIVASGSQRLLQQLTTISWPQDSTIESTLNQLLTTIQQQITQTSTIQKYKIELENNILEFTPLHSNPAFWKANAAALVADQAVLIRKLVSIGQLALQNDDKTTLGVVLNDFGMFVTHLTAGREWVEKIPGMLKVAMDSLRVEDEDLQAQAIQTVSKLLLNKVV